MFNFFISYNNRGKLTSMVLTYFVGRQVGPPLDYNLISWPSLIKNTERTVCLLSWLTENEFFFQGE